MANSRFVFIKLRILNPNPLSCAFRSRESVVYVHETQQLAHFSDRVVVMSEIMEELGISELRVPESLINKLPDDCLRTIFLFLPIAERLEFEKVCKRWRNIGERGWNDIKELSISEKYSENLIHLMLKRCGRYLRNLTIYYSSEHSHSLSMAIKFCRLDQLEMFQLICLNFKKKDIIRNSRDLREILEKSEKLVTVSLEGILHRYMLDYLILLNPETLQRLDLGNRNTNERLEFNPDRFPNLKEMYLDNIDIFEEALIREEESLKGFEKLNLGCCKVPENFLQRIGTFTNLRELGLRHQIIDVKNEHVRHIAMHCDKIKEMSLTNAINLTSDCFQYLGEMRSLEILYFDTFPMKSRDLAYLMNVKKLRFYRCHDIVKGNGLIQLITNSSNLEELGFSEIQALGRHFVSDIERVFQRGQRKKPLLVTITGWAHQNLNGLKKITYHPLLTVRIKNGG